MAEIAETFFDEMIGVHLKEGCFSLQKAIAHSNSDASILNSGYWYPMVSDIQVNCCNLYVVSEIL